MPANDESSLIADFQLVEMDYKLRFGSTFDRWQVGNSPDLMRKAIAGMKKSLETGVPLTDSDLGIEEIDPSYDLSLDQPTNDLNLDL
ncbi:hypothetical protein [Pantanalinema sp. GBBB05]|uniref:hypothetical protein n=1 Tax=Pantanalinema sp. GBBB05 TaxID=2604139 RepID=UPI001D356429|nr:hypothetical protein [Pantanalinema sp. GBBB05]